MSYFQSLWPLSHRISKHWLRTSLKVGAWKGYFPAHRTLCHWRSAGRAPLKRPAFLLSTLQQRLLASPTPSIPLSFVPWINIMWFGAHYSLIWKKGNSLGWRRRGSETIFHPAHQVWLHWFESQKSNKTVKIMINSAWADRKAAHRSPAHRPRAAAGQYCQAYGAWQTQLLDSVTSFCPSDSRHRSLWWLFRNF